MSEEESREEIEQIVNNNEEEVKEEIKEEVKEEIKEEYVGVSRDPPDGRGIAPSSVKEEIKEEELPKPKAKAKAKAKPKVKIVKEAVESVAEKIEEKEEEQPKKVDKLKQIVKCPDCGLDMTAHTLKYIHKRRGFCKADVKTPEVKTPEVRTPVPDNKQKITEDIVNDYIKQNPDVISNYLRNERAMKAQKKQMNARSLLNNAF
jgi:hypothetical protein